MTIFCGNWIIEAGAFLLNAGYNALPWQQDSRYVFQTSGLIWAGMLANSGLEAKAVRLSTASIRGPVASLHFSLFSWLKAPSKACGGT